MTIDINFENTQFENKGQRKLPQLVSATDKFYMHIFLTLTLFMLLTLLESISFVKVMVLNRDLFLLC